MSRWWEHGERLRWGTWRYVRVVGALRQVKVGGMAPGSNGRHSARLIGSSMALCQGGGSMAPC